MRVKNELKGLSELLADIPALETTKEGKLKGGFYAVVTIGAGTSASYTNFACDNSCKNACESSCHDHCNTSCQNACQNQCQESTTSSSNAQSGAAEQMVGFSFVF